MARGFVLFQCISLGIANDLFTAEWNKRHLNSPVQIEVAAELRNASSLMIGSGGDCVAFRETANCDPDGQHNSGGDKVCDEVIPCQPGHCPSGYCECAGGRRVNLVDCHLNHSPFTCQDKCSRKDDLCSQFTGPEARVTIGKSEVALGNGYTCAVFDLEMPSLTTLRGDFEGRGDYGANVLAGRVTLEREDGDGTVHTSSSAGKAIAKIVAESAERIAVSIHGIRDTSNPTVEEEWQLALATGGRSLQITTQGRTVQPIKAKAVRHSFPFTPMAVYALFDRGVVQMLNQVATKSSYASSDGLTRLYALGGSGDDLHMAGNKSVSLRRKPVIGMGVASSVVVQSNAGSASGFQEVLVGAAPPSDQWSAGWEQVSAVDIAAGITWSSQFSLAANNADFPVQGPTQDLPSTPTIPSKDLQALLTGIYASPVGQLVTHDNGVKMGHRVGQMATTIASPGYGYQGNYNFFDPDNYLSTAAMLFSGDTYLQEQVRVVLERNGDFINEKGQLPHHFNDLEPTYQALSGEVQTGPNVFWILSCLNYAKLTGDISWLSAYMPKLRFASAFLFKMIDPNLGLLNVPGSLMIDVFIRNNYTTDTNAMVVGFFREFAAAEHAVGNFSGADTLNHLSDTISASIDRNLWSKATNDHYVTQIDKDGAVRDFVDYDSNLIALAHGVAPPERAAATFKRIDAGRCTHGRATFVSEDYYGAKDTTSGNTGDSWCTMGRIGWFDALARKRYGDQTTFDNLLLDPLVGDVNRWTWLHERYNCDGSPQRNRTFMYFEYPSVTAMMLHYIRYGIQIGFENITVAPFGPHTFAYHIGNIHVDYSLTKVTLSVPGSGKKRLTVDGLTGSKFHFATVKTGGAPWPDVVCETQSAGTVSIVNGAATFEATVGDWKGPCILTLESADDELVLV